MQDKKQKPTKDPFIMFYIVWPIQNAIEAIADFFKMLWRKLTGAWWCDHCETYHGRRVHKFTYHDFICNTHIDKYMCSLGRDAKLQESQETTPQPSSLQAAMGSFAESMKQIFRT